MMAAARRSWVPVGRAFQRREYADYDTYLWHQREKLPRMLAHGKLAPYEAIYRAALMPRLLMDGLSPGARVLCLGARGGAEVRAFASLGCVAIGIDVNPGPENPDVVPGDFHHLPDGAGTRDVIFTNALDHCFDLDQVLAEVLRVLTDAGLFIVEAVQGTAEGSLPGSYESFAWQTVDALTAAITVRGFDLTRRLAFDVPWPGEHLVFRRRPA